MDKLELHAPDGRTRHDVSVHFVLSCCYDVVLCWLPVRAILRYASHSFVCIFSVDFCKIFLQMDSSFCSPLHALSIPASFLDIHAKTCLDSCQQQRQQQDPSPPSDALLTPGTHTSTPEPATQQSLTQASVPKERAAEGGGGSLEGTPSALHVMMQVSWWCIVDALM